MPKEKERASDRKSVRHFTGLILMQTKSMRFQWNGLSHMKTGNNLGCLSVTFSLFQCYMSTVKENLTSFRPLHTGCVRNNKKDQSSSHQPQLEFVTETLENFLTGHFEERKRWTHPLMNIFYTSSFPRNRRGGFGYTSSNIGIERELHLFKEELKFRCLWSSLSS